MTPQTVEEVDVDVRRSLLAAADAIGCIATDDEDHKVITDLRKAADRLTAQAREIERLNGLVYAPDGVGWRQHALDIAKERPITQAVALSCQARATAAEAKLAEAVEERADVLETLDRIVKATPANTNSRDARSALSWTSAVAASLYARLTPEAQ